MAKFWGSPYELGGGAFGEHCMGLGAGPFWRFPALHALIGFLNVQQADLAREMGVSRARLSQMISSGDKDIPANRRRQICAILRGALEGYDDSIAMFSEGGERAGDSDVVAGTLDAARAISAVCHLLLERDEAEVKTLRGVPPEEQD